MFICVDLFAFNLQIAIHKSPQFLFSTLEVPRLNFDVKPNNLNKRCETWLLTLKEEHRSSVFENGVPRKLLGTKRDEATEEWRMEMNDLY